MTPILIETIQVPHRFTWISRFLNSTLGRAETRMAEGALHVEATPYGDTVAETGTLSRS